VRETFAEALYPAGTAFEDYRLQRAEPLTGWAFEAPEFKVLKDGLKVRFNASVPLASGRLGMVKTYWVPFTGKKIGVTWSLQTDSVAAPAASILEYRFVAESLFCLLAGNAHDRYVTWEANGTTRRDILASQGDMPGASVVRLTDEWLRLRCAVKAPESVAVWRDALETVSQSESGYERVYQGTVVAPVWDVRLSVNGSDKTEFGMQVDFDEENGNA
jgi:alpha-amylase